MAKSNLEIPTRIFVGLSEKEPLLVLHVDDDPHFLRIAGECLKMQGKLEVETASSVEEALDKMKEKEYDAVISDYQMPGKDGLEFLKELRRKGNEIPFIIFTGKGREEIAAKALNLGADQYVDRHGDPETVYCELAHGIKTAVESRRAKERLLYQASLLQNVSDAIIATDQNFKIKSWNKAAEKIYGWTENEVVGKRVSDVTPAEYPYHNQDVLKQFLREGHWDGEVIQKNKKGQAVNIFSSVSSIKDSAGNKTGTVAVNRDITERRKMDEEIEGLARFPSENPNPVLRISQDNRILFANDAGKALLKRLNSEVGGLVSAFLKNLTVETLKSQSHRSEEFNIGERIYGFYAMPIVDKGYVNVYGIDITERKEAEEELHQFSTAVRTSLDGIVIGDVNGNITEINDATLRMYGGTNKGDLIGRNVLDFLVESDRMRALQDSMESMKTGQGKTIEYTALTKNGNEIPIEITTAIMRDEQGEPTGFVDIVRNIGERKKAEQTLRVSLDRYRSFIEVTGELGWTTNADGEIVEDIPSFRKFTGLTYEEIKGWGWSKALHPDDLERATRIWKEAIATRSKYEVEYRLRRHDGVYRYFIARSVPVLKEDGSIREWVGTCIDITERKKAEGKLKESEKKFKLIFERARDGILAADEKTNKFVFANPRICEITGYSEKELLRLGVEDIHPEKDLSYAMDTFTKMLQRKIEIGRDIPVLRKDRDVIYCDINSYLLEVGEGKLLVGLFRDVTERKNAEKVMMESQQKFEALFKDNPEAAVYLDLDFKVLDVNPRFCQLFGYSAKEVEGKQINEVVTPEDMIEEAERLDKNAKKGYASLDTVRKRKDGSLVHVSISAAPVTIEGKLLSYVEVYKDITDMKDTEECLKEMNKRLEATNEKLHVVGSLTRHDVRNKLSAVTGNAYLLRRKLAEDPKALEQLNDMETAVRLVERIFEFAGTYEKLGVEQLTSMDVGKTIDGSVSLFSDSKGVKIVNECGGLTVLADSLLRQLLYNLVDNSLKYGQKIRQIKIYYRTPSADQLEIVYEDDGVGIPDNMRSNLFKEGFTSGKGAGYGLFMIKRICEVYGWTINETGKQGKGAQFTMAIPRINNTGKANYQIQKVQGVNKNRK